MKTQTTFINTLASMLTHVEIMADVDGMAKLETFTKEAGFDTTTKDAAVFAAGVLIAVADGLPILENDENIGLREYGRALVSAFRHAVTPLTNFHYQLQVSTNDGLLPINALPSVYASRRFGLFGLHVLYTDKF